MAWAPFAAMAAGGLWDKFMGGDKMNKVSTMTKEQESLLSQLNQMLGQGGQLGQGYGSALGLQQQYMDPSSEAVNQFAQPYMDQFNQQTVPGLAERFAGMGGGMGGGMSSSGFGQSLSSAGGQLQNQLASLKAGLGQQAAQSLMGQYGSMQGQALGAQPFAYQQQGPSAFGAALQGWGQGGFPGAQQGGNALMDWFKSMQGQGGIGNVQGGQF